MTCNDIEILLHYYGSLVPHPRFEEPAVIKSLQKFVQDDVLKPRDGSNFCDRDFETTSKGNALVALLCNTKLPVMQWVDEHGNVIKGD